MKIRFIDHTLYIDDSEDIFFPFRIKGLIQLDDLVVVLIYGITTEEMENLPTTNIYAYDKHAKQVWQIEEPPQYPDRSVSYAGIRLEKINGKEEVVAGMTDGYECIVNTKDGSVSQITGQRPW